jgi:hypothetical protein
MSDISLIIRTADKTKKAEVTLAASQTCADVINAAVDNWALPRDSDYSIVNVSKSPPQTLAPAASLASVGVMSGETLEIQPVLKAGGFRAR